MQIKSLKSPLIKIIFSYLNDNKKLNIIINNKTLQKILEVNIQNYKNISKRIKLGERNGKGKEYLKKNKKIIFKGEYLNGKRSGKGKEYYDDGKLKFEGEYLKGKEVEMEKNIILMVN